MRSNRRTLFVAFLISAALVFGSQSAFAQFTGNPPSGGSSMRPTGGEPSAPAPAIGSRTPVFGHGIARPFVSSSWVSRTGLALRSTSFRVWQSVLLPF